MSEQTYPVRVVRDVLIPTRDGTRLAANLYLPEGAGPVPALLEYTPYLKDGRGGRGAVETAQRFFARRGYACLTLDMRGFGASEGIAAPPFSAQEKLDGYDVLEWVAAQPWCNGRTGMWGISYGGDTSLSVASVQPPSLQAIVPIHATDDEFTGVCYPHGCRGGLWGDNDWGLGMVGLQLLPPLRLDDDERWARLWRDRLERLEPLPFTWHTIPPETWAAWRAEVGAIRAATYAVSAWHDVYPAETLRAFGAIKAPKRALIGPWKHEFPDRAAHHPIGFWHEMGRWWDQWLKDVNTGIMEQPPIIAFRQPDGGYHYEDTWPPQPQQQDYFLQPEGRLATQRPSADGAATYRVDPTVGLAHLPWDWVTPTAPAPADISPDDHRALSYTTPPLDDDLDIAGHAVVVVHLAADQPDFPLAAWLSDVAPGGYATLICQGWVRPAHLLGEALQPGRVYEVRVPLLPTSYRLAAGHCLRLAMAGADFPVLVPAPTNPLLTVHHGVQHPSRLQLPLAPAGRADRPAAFAAPVREDPAAILLDRAVHTVSRDLLGRTAAHRHRHSAVYRLEGDTILRSEVEAGITIDAQAPRHISMQGVQTLTVERPVNTIVVRTEALETFDHFHIDADITVAGRPFYRRSWDLDLSQAAWRWQTAPPAATASPTT